ncbi:MAG: two component transcriptional regulator, AraC family [Paenibacillaceae bacterium]|jgi:two-component system response regulator YesN|nr:two component transcriptional regulator, AraC family [Paenibacillaceae bacterium]
MKGKLIIVDDELFIRKGLRKLIEVYADNWVVAGEAKNGEEAFQLLESLRPDLAIVDIRMPGLSGIELAERVFRQEIPVKLVILTGHKDFTHAQAAVKYNVSDFLLKPCPEQEVLMMLERMYGLILAERRQREREERLLTEEAVKALLLRLPLHDGMTPLLERQLLGRACWFVSGFADTKGKFAGNMPLLQFAMRNIMEELLDTFACNGCYVAIQYNLAALFIAYPDSAGHPARLEQELCHSLVTHIRELLGADIQMTAAGVIPSLALVPRLYEQIGLSTGAPAAGPETDGWPGGHNPLFTGAQALQDDWMYFIANGYPERLREQVMAEVASVEALPQPMQRSRAQAVSTVLQTLGRKIIRLQSGEGAGQTSGGAAGDDSGAGSGQQASRDSLLPQAPPSFPFMEILSEETDACGLRRQAEQLLDLFGEWQERSNRQAIRQTLDYIHENYMNDCSLSEVAAHVHFNPAYLSTLFRKETGERFVNYITRVRMEQAKTLLNNTDKKVAEIAQLAGYDDPNYFSTIFRKMYGVTPNKYRKND